MCIKRLSGLILLLLFCLSCVYSQDARELSSLEQPTASRKILNIADEITSIADKWDEHQNYLNQLMSDLQTSRTDSAESRVILERTQANYAVLRNDYGLLQVRLRRLKTISIALGTTSIISAGTTILALVLN